MQKLTGYPPSLQWYVNIGHGITSLALGDFQKVTKWTGFCDQRSNTQHLIIFGIQVCKSGVFYPESLNAKTDRLSFPFVMICGKENQ